MLLLRRLSHEGACEAAKCIEELSALREKLMQERLSHAHAQEDNNIEETATEDFENYTMELPMAEIDENTTSVQEND